MESLPLTFISFPFPPSEYVSKIYNQAAAVVVAKHKDQMKRAQNLRLVVFPVSSACHAAVQEDTEDGDGD